jgi:Leucine carboxyl methyltransferase
VFSRSEHILGAKEAVVNHSDCVTMEAIEGHPAWDGTYHLVPHDLRQDIRQLASRLSDCGFDSTVPVLFILECCLMYLPDVSTRELLQGLPHICADAYVFLYEPIVGTDSFGRVMETNLTRAGVVDSESTLIQSRTLSRQIDNLVRAGFVVAAGCDMWAAFETVLTTAQRQHANRCEFLDEMEEWMLIMRHYCMIVASTPNSTFGKEFCRVGNDSVMGLVTGRCDEALGETE